MQLTFQFRLYPTSEQEQHMNQTLDLCRKLYNKAKEQRDTAYNQDGKTITYAMQQNELPAFKKEFPEYKEVHSQVLQDCLRRLDDAYQRFFRGETGFLITNQSIGTSPLRIRSPSRLQRHSPKTVTSICPKSVLSACMLTVPSIGQM